MPRAIVCVSSAGGYMEQLKIADWIKKGIEYSRPGSRYEGVH